MNPRGLATSLRVSYQDYDGRAHVATLSCA